MLRSLGFRHLRAPGQPLRLGGLGCGTPAGYVRNLNKRVPRLELGQN
jgi:hypothetical protein